MERVISTLVRDVWSRISSNRRPVSVVIGLALGLVLAGAPVAVADAGDPLSYYGGPVVHASTGVVVDWGPNVNPIFTDPTAGDPGLIENFASSSGGTGDIGGVLAQYMDQRGDAAPNVTFGGEYPITPSVTSSTIDDQQIQNELVQQIESRNLPEPVGRDGLGSVYLVLFPAGDTECLDSGDTECSGTSFCAYHGNATLPDGTAVLYAVLPDDTTGPMSQDCGPASSPLANETSYLSHEWSESITDPLVGEAASGSSYPLAWYDNNCSMVDAICGEIGDKCNQLQGANGGWTVQLEWSNLDATCESGEPRYGAPTASFTSGASIYAGLPLAFDATESSDPTADETSMTFDATPYSIPSGIASYGWNWGDGTGTDSGQTANHTFANPGVYPVSLTVTDNLGFTSTVTQPVVVWSTSPPVAPDVITAPATGIDDQDETLNGSIDPQNQPVIYSFAYGTSPGSLDQATPSADLAPGPNAVPVSATLSGLSPATTYYYQLNVDLAGQTSSGDIESFTTGAAPQNQSRGGGSSPGGGGTTTSPTPPSAPGGQTPPASAPAATRLPSAATGGAIARTSSSATIAGGVDPDGLQTSYLVEFGGTTAYGHSSARTSAGAGTSNAAVRATLTGLRARTFYHYRLVAINAAGTAVGADRTFTTRAAPPPPPRFSFLAPARITLAQALAGKLRVSFRSSAACTARFAVTLVLPGITRLQAIPVTLARGSGRTFGVDRGQVTLRFTAALRSALRNARSLKLEISGYAVRGSSAPSSPRIARLTVIR